MRGERARARGTRVANGKEKRRESYAHFSFLVARRFNNLPIPLTELVGRQAEIAEARSLLQGTALLTLTGAGGSGKTRLALALAGDAVDEYQDGVVWVDLAGLQDGALLWPAVGQALGLPETPGQSPEQIVLNYLAPGHWLLVLDNCEHLIDACARLAALLLSTCPHVRLLCTSREPLAITGEIVWSVPVLSTPEPPFSPARLLQYDAPRLFIARVRAVNPHFAPTEDNAQALAQICRRLDGMPLALELAAARVRVLSVEQIAARLGNRFELLTSGSRTALPRHQTLRSTIDWSYDLLTEPERVLFRRLAVFPASFPIEAAEYVCADPAPDAAPHPGPGAQVASRDVVDLLAHLVDKSLVLVQPGRTARYRMLETISQYAREKLEQAGELVAVSERHFEYFTALVEQAGPKLISAEQGVALGQLDAERDNWAAALDWALASDPATSRATKGRCLHLSSSLWRFWQMRGRPMEGRLWLERALAATQSLGRTPKRARGLAALGCLTWLHEDLALGRIELEEAAGIAAECGDALLQADAERWLGFVLTDQGHLDRARELVEKSLEVFGAAGDRWNYAHALFVLGRVHMDLRLFDRAISLYESSLQVFRQLGDHWGTALPVGHLGVIAAMKGDAKTARRLLEERLQLARETGSLQQLEFALWWLGKVAMDMGQNREAELRFNEALELSWQAGFLVSAVQNLESLGWVARANGQPARGARLFGAAEALLVQVSQDSPRLAEHERELSALRAEMRATDFAASWAEGAAMRREDAIAYARQFEAAPSEAPPATLRQAARAAFGGLSPREREVARLVAEGKSNRQIAELLVVSERTVTTHVANIFSKLGFNSRAQVAAWAVQHGLLEKQRGA